jgi:tetratricopeptide (TPR) repeat protein
VAYRLLTLIVMGIALPCLAPDNSKPADSLTQEGIQLYRTRNLPEAVAALRRALRAHPASLEARIYLARALIQEERVPEALREVRILLERFPADPEAQFQAGRLLQELAGSRFARLQRLAPDAAGTHELLGKYYEAQGRLQEALTEYRLALERNPEGRGLHFFAGNVYWKLRKFDEALRELQAELALNPNHTLANHRVGHIYVSRREAGEAIPYLQRALGGDSSFLEAHRDLGRAFRMLERWEEALREFQFVAERRPEDDTIHAQLAAVYKALGDKKRAAAELEMHERILRKRLEAAQRK